MLYVKDKNFISKENTVVTFGKFDGIHNGHRLLIEKAVRIGHEQGIKVVLCTFNMDNWNAKPQKAITTPDERAYICEKYGIDVLYEYPFDNEIAGMLPEDFLKYFLKEKLNAKFVVIGADWRFGKNRSGDAALLKAYEDKYCYSSYVIEKETYNNTEISSTWIRNEIEKSDLSTVKKLLGYDYFFKGKVVHGKQLGRTIGFPTLNLIPSPNKILPEYGVYESEVVIDNLMYKGVTNIGIRPTIDDGTYVTVETFVLDFDEDVYDSDVIIRLKKFIRPEQKFDSVNGLKKQLEADIAFVRG